MKNNAVYLCMILCLIILTGSQAAHAAWIPDGVEVAPYVAPDPNNESRSVPDGAGGAVLVWQDTRNGNQDIYVQRIDSSCKVLWTFGGVPLCTATGSQLDPQITSDGVGGAIVTWRDYRNGTDYNIYTQRVDALGVVQWITDGVPLCTTTEHQLEPQITSDGAGGAIVTWHDNRSGDYGDYDIYAQRVDASGTVQWIADGMPFCTATGSQMEPQITSDGVGGAIVTWRDYRNGTDSDIYAQCVDASGTAQWITDGVPLCTATRNQTDHRIESDGAGGAIVTWEDYRSGILGNLDIYAQRVDALGAVQWTTDGVSLCVAASTQDSPQIASDGAGEAIITWQDYRSGNMDIYAQRVDALGAVQWTTDGVPVCTATGSQYSPQLISDEAGGVIVMWKDGRIGSGDYGIYTQRVDALGAVQWTAGGVPLCTLNVDQFYPQITSDGAGGVIVTWQDERSGYFDIFVQRINNSGVVQWTMDVMSLCAATGDQSYPQITSDGTGGAIVTWQDYRNGTGHDIYAQRVDALGAVQWTMDGMSLCAATGDQSYPQITSDGAGGVIVTWQDNRSGDYGIYVQLVDASGTVQWATDGVPLCTATEDQDFPQITSDGAGGAIVTWQDKRSGYSGNLDCYAQRVDALGAVQWTADGVPLCTAAFTQNSPQITSDGAGGAIVTWQDNRSGYYLDCYAQRVDALGAVQWTMDGISLCAATGDQSYPQITSDSSGGAIVTWKDYRNGNDYDIYAQRINTSGTIQWTADGVALCTATENQLEAQITSDGAGGAIVTWQDYRNGTDYDIYAQRVDALGAVRWTADGVPLCTSAFTQDSPQIISNEAGGAFVTWQDKRSAIESRIYLQRTTDIGLGPLCEIYPEVIEIPGSIETGTYIDTSFTITNIGIGTLVGYVEETCDNFDIVSGGGSYGLFNGHSRVVTIRFEPAEAGTHLCEIETGMYLCCDVSVTGTAYACPPGSVLYVDADAFGANDGTSWGDACTTLYDALDRLELCDNVTEIWVADGTYYPTGGTDRDATFHLRDGLAIYGGFAGTETMLSERDLFVNSSVLSGDIGVADDNSDNSYNVVTGTEIDNTSVLDGFTITGGNAEVVPRAGGGMFNVAASPVLRNIIFRGNYASTYGGGMYNRNGSNAILYNVVFYQNFSGEYGGGIYNTASSPVLVNVTFCENFAYEAGGGICNELYSHTQLTNVIMWGDSAGDDYLLPEIENNLSNPVISYSLVEGCIFGMSGWQPAYGIDGGNNLDIDPEFVNVSGGDLHLLDGSAAIDAGDAAVPGIPATDLDGRPRIKDGYIDMGAYEGDFSFVAVVVVTDPANLEIILDGDTLTAPSSIFMARSGETYEIGAVTPQVQGEMHYSFTGWSDAGDTIHTVIIPDDPVTYTASFSGAYLYAAIDSIVDVPGDQGGWARVYFKRSYYDDLLETLHHIYQYDVHRRVDNPVLAAGVMVDGILLKDDHHITLMDGSKTMLRASTGGEGPRYVEYDSRYFVVSGNDLLAAPPGIWEVVGVVSAQQQTDYIGLVPTLGDSSATIPWSVYYISANSTTPGVYFDSPADSGYSVDNIVPGVPLGMAVAYNTGSGNQVSWDASPEPDFQYYRIYRGDEESFVPGPANLVHQTITPVWNDPDYDGWDVYYKVTVLDHAGNESDAASPGSTTGEDIPGLPKAHALYQNVPNPFNPATVIKFDLPQATYVRLFVYNVKGELVSRIVDRQMTAGQKRVDWNAVDARGRRLSSGMYFYRLTAGDFAQTRKMILLR